MIAPAVALRPLTLPCGPRSHVDPIDVEELAELDRGRVDVDAVLVDGDRSRRVRVVVLQPDPTDEDGGVRRCEGGVDLEVRRVIGEVGDVFDPQRLQVAGSERRARSRGILEGVLLLTGDQDLLDVTALEEHLVPIHHEGFTEVRGIGCFGVALDVRRIGGVVGLRRCGVLVGVDGILGRGGNDQ